MYFCRVITNETTNKITNAIHFNMCQISKATVIRANRRMIERRGVRSTERVVSSNGDFYVSVRANGKVYTQVITRDQIRKAYGMALAKNSAIHGAEL